MQPDLSYRANDLPGEPTQTPGSESEIVELHQHLETCSHCQAVLAEYRAMDVLITSLPPVEPLPAMPVWLRELVGVSNETVQTILTHTSQETPSLPVAPASTRTSANPSRSRLAKKLNWPTRTPSICRAPPVGSDPSVCRAPPSCSPSASAMTHCSGSARSPLLHYSV